VSLHLKTAAELGRGIRAGEFSSGEVTRHFLDRIGQGNRRLNAFITVTAEHALEDQVQRLRPDEPTETDRREEYQRNAPAVEAGLYIVPKVIE
jgi:aspartyl/glutamyl-tRNA(Asn/Gln) amidotransferase C subunit